ncbi:MAG: hypothetical protein JNK63_07470 [Chthonomonas sp.]|nr:hypothetical protein [Chthonomonas sp.]
MSGQRNPLLERAVRAQAKLRFTGVRRMVMRLGPQARTNVERVWQDGSRYRVEFEPGSVDAGQVIVIANGVRSHFFPSSNEIQVRPAMMDEPLMRLGEMLRGGRGTQIKESSGGAVAGQQTNLLTFSDSNGNAIGKLWVDPDTAMVLKRELFDASGRLVGSMEFIRVDLNPKFDESDFKITRKGARVVTIDEMLRRLAGSVGVRPLRLQESSGFILEAVNVVPLGEGKRALSQSYFSRQGKRVSVFITRSSVDARRISGRQGPALASIARTIGDLTVVLIGNVPQADLQKLADQVN